ncbi:hypothetical protein Sdia_02290 [Streptomyces diastaticus subsp. diastaticus]|uniref:Uncharacterized protein n=1 Tax=Streptomyces diastaticus subsp. diastaticus TaxID=68040 RepID=A0ABQ1CHI1_STRDI|nr:hypothetical protein Srut_20540 [Streptomyces rutgersensis]GFH69461.1 hypothetical protein Sdia_02290 [Streptomyces diastaticus subsp. diastaticus]GGU36377.1 hypothetical protein GCM10015534_43670 [Streptomyces diastaticus subsp. diastaticus]
MVPTVVSKRRASAAQTPPIIRPRVGRTRLEDMGTPSRTSVRDPVGPRAGSGPPDRSSRSSSHGTQDECGEASPYGATPTLVIVGVAP